MPTRTRLETVMLEKMVHGGKALARLADGQVALVRGGIPGERVLCEVQVVSGVWQGEVVEVLEGHVARVPASRHPGLDYSFMNYDKQRQVKLEVLQDTFARSQRNDRSTHSTMTFPEVIAAPDIWHYRHSVQPAVHPNTPDDTSDSYVLGYRQPDSHEVTVLTEDPVANVHINAWWHISPPKGGREVVFRSNQAGDVLICLIAQASAKHYLDMAHDLVRQGVAGVSYAPFDARGRFRQGSERLAGKRYVLEQYGAFSVRVTPHSFAQPNPLAATRLYQDLQALVREHIPANGRVLDLFAGSGIIGFYLADIAAEVVALEIDTANVTYGKQAAKHAGLDNVTFVKGDVRQVDLPPAALICVNPPRAGLAKNVRERIQASRAKAVCYVSCDVATWSRDVAALQEAGFALVHAQPYDFYPHTHHIEMLSLLVRTDNTG
jgi:tRNA/tmRNA/rRNA uracil-C5-methylase (TrmA/RlmC/RlmD family)